MTLPYDIARCHGRDWPECVDCLRRLSQDRPGFTDGPDWRRPAPPICSCAAGWRV